MRCVACNKRLPLKREANMTRTTRDLCERCGLAVVETLCDREQGCWE